MNATEINENLKCLYLVTRCALDYNDPQQLLIAVILSAQCTDIRVNQVTRTLFRVCPTLEHFDRMSIEDLEKAIYSTGFYRAKAKHIKDLVRILMRDFGGKIPLDMGILTTLPGIGRKTANVVLGTGFGIASGVVVDTHVRRLSNRLKLTKSQNPVVIERELAAQVPQCEWIDFSHRLIYHGRRVCHARKPQCNKCIFRFQECRL